MPPAVTARSTTWWPVALFAVLATVHLLALLLEWPSTTYTQWLLVPPLLAVLLLRSRSVRHRLVRWATLALALSWLGDALPGLLPVPARLLCSIVVFGLVQGAWIMAFRPYWRQSILATRPQLLVPYAIAVVGLIGVCIPGAGSFWPAVVVFGLLLVAMPVLATAVGARSTWGGIAFVLCGGLTAWRAFVPGFDFPQSDFAIMLAYLTAQTLLVAGVLQVSGRPSRVVVGATPATVHP